MQFINGKQFLCVNGLHPILRSVLVKSKASSFPVGPFLTVDTATFLRRFEVALFQILSYFTPDTKTFQCKLI